MRSRCSSADIGSAVASAALASLEIVRVDDQRLGQLARGAGELAQHEHAALVVARGDELLRDQVHAVVQAAHVAEVRGAIVAEHRRRLVVRAQQDDRADSRAVPKRALIRVGERARRSR